METEQVSTLFELTQKLNLTRMLGFFFGMIFLVALVKIIQFWSDHLYKKFPLRRLLLLQVFTTLSFMLYIFGTIGLLYSTFRPTSEMLIAFGGTAAVAFGFAIKDFVGSLVAGLILLFDRPFQVGDRVSFEGVYGEIKSIGLRAVRLVTLDDNIVTIPNNKFITEKVASGNAGELNMMVETFFYISLSEDFEKVRTMIYEVICTSRFCYLNKPILITAKEEEVARQLALKIAVKSYVLDVKFEKAFETDIVIRVQKAFHENKVQRPSPLPAYLD